jgi:hypothetical protein
MGELNTVMAALSGVGMTDREILAVINPPASERNRSALVTNPRLPAHNPARMTTPIGNALTTHTVRSNHFKMNFANIPGTIYHYHVHIYKVNSKTGETGATDCINDEDTRITIGLMDRLRIRHPDWKNIGYAYDGRSGLYTSADLSLPNRNSSDEPFWEEVVGIMDVHGEKLSNYCCCSIFKFFLFFS